MKKLVTFFFLVVLIANTGCKKPTDDPIGNAVVYTITSSTGKGGVIEPAGSTTFEPGKSIIYKIKSNTNYSILSIKVNADSVPVSNTFEFKNIKANNIIHVEFVSNDFLVLTKGSSSKTRPWFLKSIEDYDLNNKVIDTVKLDPSQLTNKGYYYTNGTFEFFNPKGDRITNGEWSLDGNIFTQGEKNTVITLTDKIFSYQRPITQPNGNVVYMRLNFVRP